MKIGNINYTPFKSNVRLTRNSNIKIDLENFIKSNFIISNILKRNVELVKEELDDKKRNLTSTKSLKKSSELESDIQKLENIQRDFLDEIEEISAIKYSKKNNFKQNKLLSTIKLELKDLVKFNKMLALFQKFEDLINSSKKNYNKFVHFQSRYCRINEKYNNGLINHNEHEISMNLLILAIIQMIDTLTRHDLK